ncbi:MAG: tyrosine--tRNA ligase [Patescibacteria group bacterium]
MAKISTDPKKIEEILSRGVAEVIEKDHLRSALLSGRKLRVKLGIDPTSPNIHLGRTVVLRKLRAFQDLGHQIIFIIGDFTGIIGDTSDKESERPMLSEKDIKVNMKDYFKQAFKILNPKKTETYHNSKWLSKIGFLELARIANLFGLHEFESREVIARRMKEGKRVSYLELMYPLFQGYDSVKVRADVELGGTDQRFNLLTGRHIQPLYKQRPQDILMTELLEGTDGRKMSSSYGNVINITDEANDMFGKVMALDDRLMEHYFVLGTNLSTVDIADVLRQSPKDAKMRLAREITALYHGTREAEQAEAEFSNVFSRGGKPADIPVISLGAPSMALVDLLIATKLAPSKSEARRLIEQGAVRVNDFVKKNNYLVDIYSGKDTLIQVGPRKFVKISQ